MPPRVAVLPEPVASLDHYLKSELYSRVRADSEIFEFLQAGSLDGIWYWDLENPENEWMSPRFKDLFGYEEHEIPSSSSWWQQNIYPEDLPGTIENFHKHCADSSFPYDQIVRYRHKNGSTVWVRCRGLAIRDEADRPIRMLGAHTDVTAIKRTEERLRALYEASTEMSFVADLETAIIIECNQAFRDLCGRQIIPGVCFFALCDPACDQKGKAFFAALKAESEIKDWELRLRRNEDEFVAVVLSARAVTDPTTGASIVRAWCRDITHLKQLANVEVLIDAVPTGILLLDERGVISAANTAAQAMFGYSKGELTGKSISNLLANLSESEQRGIRNDGTPFPIHLELKTVKLGDRVFQTASIADLAARKGIEKSLRDSEHRFRQLTECLPQLVWTCTADGACDYLSPQWVQYTGKPEAQQLETGWLEQVHPDDRTRLILTWSDCVRIGTPFQSEYRIRRHDGEYRWFNTSGVPLRNAESQIMKWFGASTDVTELKQAEADQRFLAQFGGELQSTSNPQAIAEMATKQMATYFGATRCTLHSIDLARRLAILVSRYQGNMGPAAPPIFSIEEWGNRDLFACMAAGQTVAIDNTSLDPLTTANYVSHLHAVNVEALVMLPMRREGRCVSVLSLIQSEIRHWTERELELARTAAERTWFAYDAARALAAERAMHAALADSEHRLQLAMQSAAIGIWDNDPVTNVNNWDARSRAIFGFPPDLKIDADLVMSCIHPDDRAAVQHSLQLYLDPAGTGHFEIDYRIFTWNGNGIRHIFAQGQMFYEGSGARRKPVRATGTVQDITELKKGEQALRRANLELERFAYAAAHDLQEPLRNVGLASQLLSSRYGGKFDKEADMLLKISAEGAIRMQAMVKDLLAYSRAVVLEEGTVLYSDANSVLSSALANLALAIQEKGAQISADQLPKIRMNESHLLQLLQNLIGNSLKYSGTNQPVIHIGYERRSGEVVLFVKDNGVGIPPQYHERAFGVFKRLHNQDVPGTGIGLALCKRIVEHYGGQIWIESPDGDGTKVLFTPPLAEHGA